MVMENPIEIHDHNRAISHYRKIIGGWQQQLTEYSDDRLVDSRLERDKDFLYLKKMDSVGGLCDALKLMAVIALAHELIDWEKAARFFEPCETGSGLSYPKNPTATAKEAIDLIRIFRFADEHSLHVLINPPKQYSQALKTIKKKGLI